MFCCSARSKVSTVLAEACTGIKVEQASSTTATAMPSLEAFENDKVETAWQRCHQTIENRPKGEGSSICQPFEQHDWNNVGTAPSSFFSHIRNEKVSYNHRTQKVLTSSQPETESQNIVAAPLPKATTGATKAHSSPTSILHTYKLLQGSPDSPITSI